MTWTVVCAYPRLEAERGVAARVRGAHVAIFRLLDGSLHAIGNICPVTGAAVLARGVVRLHGRAPTVSSHERAYDLRTGECVDAPKLVVPVYPVRVRSGLVEVRA